MGVTGRFLNGWVNEWDVWWRAGWWLGEWVDGQMDGWICAPTDSTPRPPRMAALRGGCHTLTSLGQCSRFSKLLSWPRHQPQTMMCS